MLVEFLPGYKVTPEGIIYGRKGQQLKSRITDRGYELIRIAGKNRKVHRIVAAAFVPGSGEQVNHKDGNKLNNNAANLEWVSNDQNRAHAIKAGLYKVRPVLAIKNDHALWFPTISEAARNGFTVSGVCEVLQGKYRRHRGYRMVEFDLAGTLSRIVGAA